MILREETQEDTDAVRALVEAAFGQPLEAGLVGALRTSGEAVLSLVAEDGGRITGHILFSKLQAPERCLALAPLSVAPERQGQGIGSALMRIGLARVRADGWRAVFLLGDPDYYRRFGFSVAAAEKFESDYPKPCFMALELAAGALDGAGRKVTFARAFQTFE
jgi:putative acetyltransferase